MTFKLCLKYHISLLNKCISRYEFHWTDICVNADVKSCFREENTVIGNECIFGARCA